MTVIAAGTNVVTQVRQPATDGYNAVQIGFGEIEGRKVTKPLAGHFAKAGVTPRRHVRRSAPPTPRATRSARSSAPSCSRQATRST